MESIRLEPPSADLVSLDRSMPTVEFQAIGRFANGSERRIPGPIFAIDTPTLGTLDVASGRFVASGVIGGAATVTVRVLGPSGPLSAQARVSVRLLRTLIGPNAPEDAAARFNGATPVADNARSAELVYPLDGAVMPQNVYPSDLQWLRGSINDLFRISLTKPNATTIAYVGYDGLNHWLVDAAAWRAVAQTDPTTEATIVVDRLDAATGEVIAGRPVRVRFARAALTGTVYYWDIEAGQIVRIDDGTATRTSVMPTPPRGTNPEDAQCVGCHAISNSGRYMAGRLGGGENVGGMFDLTTDLTGPVPPSTFPIRIVEPTSARWWFSSFSPDDSRLVVSAFEARPVAAGPSELQFLDPLRGERVPVSGEAPTNITHPAWSPDGTQIAYVGDLNTFLNTDGNTYYRWGGRYEVGNIYTVDVGGDAFGARRLIHNGASLATSAPGGLADSYPTWTPDSTRIAFGHGGGSRSEDQTSALYLMGRDGSNVVRLTQASGGPGTADNFQPRFSPFAQDGYFWLSFLSRRDYGNEQVGTRGRALQQIWVAAIRVDASPGEDPSAVPYWLPGQAVTSRNISAFWAPRACRRDGESCSVGSECCGGDCRPGGDGALVCSPPPVDRCRTFNETCTTSTDCCEGLTCFGNVCIPPLE